MAPAWILLAGQFSCTFTSSNGTWLLKPTVKPKLEEHVQRVGITSRDFRAAQGIYFVKMGCKGRKTLSLIWPGWCTVRWAESKIRGGQELRRHMEGAWSRTRFKATPSSSGWRLLQRHREACEGTVPLRSHGKPLDRNPGWRRRPVLQGLNGQSNTQHTWEWGIIYKFTYTAQCLSVCTYLPEYLTSDTVKLLNQAPDKLKIFLPPSTTQWLPHFIDFLRPVAFKWVSRLSQQLRRMKAQVTFHKKTSNSSKPASTAPGISCICVSRSPSHWHLSNFGHGLPHPSLHICVTTVPRASYFYMKVSATYHPLLNIRW